MKSQIPPQKWCWTSLALLTLVLNFANYTFAQTSATSISFQGALNGANGQPLANANYSLTFKFYDVPTGGIALATSNVPDVPVIGGIASTPIPVDAAWFNGQTRHLGIAIAGVNGGQELAPRVLITAVPYAISANSLTAPVMYLNGESLILNPTEVADPENGFWSLQPNAFFPGQFGIVRYHPSADFTRSLIIGPNGNVGIGVDKAEATFDCGGFAQFRRGLLVQNTLGQTAIRVDPETGNVGIGTRTPQTSLEVVGTTRTTVLQITSDRNAKTEFKPVDNRAVLKKLVALPITTWAYTNAPSIRHLGPVAQDFAAAFAVGDDDKHIATVDADGVAIAAIQGLNGKLEEQVRAKDAKIESVEKRLAELERLVTILAGRTGKEEKATTNSRE